MLFYVIKLINPQTKEIYFEVTARKPELPSKEIMDKFQGAVLIIQTTQNILKKAA